MRLSQYIAGHHQAVGADLATLNCSSCRITDIDVEQRILIVLLARSSSAYVRDFVHHLEKEHARLPETRHATCGADKSTLNIAVCSSVTAVFLGDNRISNLMGIVAFKNVRKLMLEMNQILTIEDCEPLGVLEALENLSLIGNPVAQLPNYRPHMVRICSFSSDTAPTSRPAHQALKQSSWCVCRLRCLDGQKILSQDVAAYHACLIREQALIIPAVETAVLLIFVNTAMSRLSVHDEMRRKGLVFVDTWKPLSLRALLAIGGTVIAYHKHREYVAHHMRSRVVSLARSGHSESSNVFGMLAAVAVDMQRDCVEQVLRLAEMLGENDPGSVVQQLWSSRLPSALPSERNDQRDSIDLNRCAPTQLASSSGLPVLRSRLARVFAKWRTMLLCHLHFRHRAWQRCLSHWRLRVAQNQKHRRLCHMATMRFVKTKLRQWRVILTGHNAVKTSLIEYVPQTVGTAICRMKTLPLVYDDVVLAMRRLADVTTSLLLRDWRKRLMQQRCSRLRLTRMFFDNWATWLRLRRLRPTTTTSRSTVSGGPVLEVCHTSSNALGCCAAVGVGVNRRVDVALQTNVELHPATCEATSQTNGNKPDSLYQANDSRVAHLCETLQDEKLQLVRRVIALERSLAEQGILFRSVNSVVETMKHQLETTSRDRDCALEAVEQYEEERVAHLAVIKRLTQASSH